MSWKRKFSNAKPCWVVPNGGYVLESGLSDIQKKQIKDAGGLRFASKSEAKRYLELRSMQETGAISELRTHPKYDIYVNGRKILPRGYTADFAYWDERLEVEVVEDVKGREPRDWKIKWELAQALYPDCEWRVIK